MKRTSRAVTKTLCERVGVAAARCRAARRDGVDAPASRAAAASRARLVSSKSRLDSRSSSSCSRHAGSGRLARARRDAVVALGQGPVGVREPVELEVVVGLGDVVRRARARRRAARAARPACSRKAGTTATVTSVTMPSAPSPSRAACEELGLAASASTRRPSRRRARGAAPGSRPARPCRRSPVPWVPVAIAPASLCRSMSPRLGRAQPKAASSALSTCSGVPARTVASPRVASIEVTPSAREPQLHAVGDGDAGERVAGADRLDPQAAGAARGRPPRRPRPRCAASPTRASSRTRCRPSWTSRRCGRRGP